MSSEELATFEAFCTTLYSSPSAEERRKAEEALVQLSQSTEYIPRCQFVLQNSTKPYAPAPRSDVQRPLDSSRSSAEHSSALCAICGMVAGMHRLWRPMRSRSSCSSHGTT